MSEEAASASLAVWIELLLTAGVSFWCQAAVTEESFLPRLVGALNVIAEHFQISDDVAGATLMAAGASSPELFTSFVALFVTHSAMGLGTIVGSEIFNQLVICAGAVYASKTGKLQLDRAIVNREVGFYALSIALLYFALQDIRPVDYDEKDHIFISFADACLVFGGYIAYVLVCANMASVVSFASRIENSLGSFTSTPVISKQSSLNLVENDDEQNEGDVEEDRVLIDKDHLTIKIEHAKHKEQDVTLVAPSKDVFDQVLEQEELTKLHHLNIQPAEPHPVSSKTDHGSLISFPAGASPPYVLLWTLVLPLRYAMHYSVPDVDTGRGSKPSVKLAYLATFMCILWLVGGSYAMVSSLEALARLLDVPDAVVGVTVSAAGTSLPNYIASRIAAEKGLGNQAVSNAFGSNIFNILVGLGLPWLLYTSFGTGFESYSELRNDDILESIVILAVVLLVFVVLMLHSGYLLLKWHGALFVAMYVAYLGLVVGQNWSWDTSFMQSYMKKDG